MARACGLRRGALPAAAFLLTLLPLRVCDGHREVSSPGQAWARPPAPLC